MQKTLLLSLLLAGLPGLAQESFSFQFDGLNRNYLVYRPSSAGTAPLPVVLVLHGYTQTASGIMQYSGFNEIAEREGFLAVYPNGVSFSWNVGFPGNSSADDLGFLSALIDTLDRDYHIDLGRVYACGMSNGGFMSHRLGCELSGRIAAIAGVTGTMSSTTYNSCNPGRVPVLHIHGTADVVVNYYGAIGMKSVNETLAFWRQHNGCPATATFEALPDLVIEGSRAERYTYAPCEEDSEVMHLKIINGGDTLPGSNGLSGTGITNRDISASEEIWAFFSRHRLSGLNGASAPSWTGLSAPPYPNPFNQQIKLDAPAGIRSLVLLDSRGRVVLRESHPGAEASLSTMHLPPGLYILRATGNHGEIHNWKVIKTSG